MTHDVSTEGGLLRYTIDDLGTQIEAAHTQLDLLAYTVGVDVPRLDERGLTYTPGARMYWLRGELERRNNEFLLDRKE